MRSLALPVLLLLLAGCSSQSPVPVDEPLADESRASRLSDRPEALLVQPGSPYTWQGATDSCTGLKMPNSCAGQSHGGLESAGIGVQEVVQTLRLTLDWTADSDASRVLAMVVVANGKAVANASGPSPLELDITNPPESLRVFVRLPEPEIARVGEGRSQAFQGRAEALV